MNTHAIHSDLPAAEYPSAARRPQRLRWSRLKPHTATLMSSMVSLLLVAVAMEDYYRNGIPWTAQITQGIVIFAGFFAVDRLDEWFYRPAPRRWLAAVLLGLRLALLAVLASTVEGYWFEIFVFASIAYLATSYFGLGAGLAMAALALGSFVTAQWQWRLQHPLVRDSMVYSVLLAIVIAAGNFTRELDQRRVEVENVLANLERIHARLQASAERARRATLERNQLVSEIHEAVGRGLATVEAELDRARTAGAEVIGTAKQVASEALQNVRRSVGTLRSTAEITSLHAVLDESILSHPPGQDLPRWRAWLLGSPIDLIQGASYLLFLVAYVLLARQEYPDWAWPRFLVAGLLLSLLAIDHIEYGLFGDTPPADIAFGFVLARVGLFGIFVMLARGHWPLWLLFFVPHISVRYTALPRVWWRQAVIWTSLAALVILVQRRALTTDYHLLSASTVFFAFILLFGWTTSRTMLHDRVAQLRVDGLLAALQDSHAALKRSVEDELATIEERNRLARDIHDGLGHYLTVVNIQLEKALAYWDRDRQVAEDALANARQMAGEALRDVQATTGELEPSQMDLSLPVVLQELVQHAGESLDIDLQIVESEAGFAPSALFALYRVAQEGLTNIQKHARASEITLHLVFGEQTAELDLHDNGQGFDPAALPDLQTHDMGHYGLKGLRERLEAVGGSLTIESTPGTGTRLHVVVPRTGRLPAL